VNLDDRSSLNDVVLFEEDFADLAIGTASTYPSTAEGEYHVVDRSMGRWTQATIHGSWNRGRGPNWRVIIEEDGRHVMAHTLDAPVGPPMLTAGDQWLGDYAFEAQIRPLSFEGAIGLVVRYQDCRCYVAVRLTEGQVALVHRHHGAERLLASRGYAFGVDRYYTVRVTCQGTTIRVSIDGEPVLEGQESEYLDGKVGFWAEVPARFTDLRLTTSDAAQARAQERADAWAAEEQALRDALPKPVLWKKLSTAGFGTDRNLRFGDLDGDGELEIVLSQRVDLGGGNYPTITCLTAMDLDGEILWQIGEPSDLFEPATSDNCFQVYDLDGDGCDEVLFCKDLQIFLADGRTGEIIRSAPTPYSRPAHTVGGRPYERILGDAVYIVNLSGGPRPQEILIKDRYANIWAMDADFNLLWHHECTTGHFPASFDIDGDGCEEVMGGYTLLDQDGTMLWQLPYGDHQDATAIGYFDAEHPEQLLIGQAAGDEGFLLMTGEGEMLAQHKLGHVQKLAVANVRPDLPGLEYVIITFWRQPGIMAVFNSRGKMVDTFELVPYASALTPVNWSGDGQELLFLSAHPTEGGLIDGHGHRAVMFPDDGHPYYCCTSLDLTGDGRDELVTWDTESIWIYRADAPLPEGRRYCPIRPPNYNESNYMAQISLPNWA
jgi:hypothetical protein